MVFEPSCARFGVVLWFGWLTQRLCRILLLHPRHHQTLIKRKRSGQSLSTTSVETLCCQTPAQRRTATVATNLVGGGCAKAMELVQIELVLAPSHVSCRVIANIVSARFFVQGNFAGQLGDGAAIYLGEVGSTRVAAFAAFAAFAAAAAAAAAAAVPGLERACRTKSAAAGGRWTRRSAAAQPRPLVPPASAAPPSPPTSS